MTFSPTLPARIRNIGLSGRLIILARVMRDQFARITRPAKQDEAFGQPRDEVSLSHGDPGRSHRHASSRDVADRLAIRAGLRAGNW